MEEIGSRQTAAHPGCHPAIQLKAMPPAKEDDCCLASGLSLWVSGIFLGNGGESRPHAYACQGRVIWKVSECQCHPPWVVQLPLTAACYSNRITHHSQALKPTKQELNCGHGGRDHCLLIFHAQVTVLKHSLQILPPWVCILERGKGNNPSETSLTSPPPPQAKSGVTSAHVFQCN